MNLSRYFIVLLAATLLSGCASMFDAPYEELAADEAAIESSAELIDELEPGDLQALIANNHSAQKHYDDLWARIRSGFAVSDLDNDPQVNRVARRMATDKLLERMAQRASGLLYYVVNEVDRDQRKLPMEVVLVPFVESGYTLNAISQAEAQGAWQFIENTAKTYELNIDRFRDERRSLVTSTRAALDYLSKLNGMFHSWPLAMAAYNVGEKRIQFEINRARARGIKNPGFNDIAANLPQETRDYVPRIFAFKKLIAAPAAYKITLPHIDNAPRHSVVEMHRDVDVAVVAKLAGLSLGEFQALNPSLRTPIIVGSSRTQLLLPHAAALQLSLNFNSYAGPWVSWRMVVITRPTTPGEIARRNNLPVRTITQANPLPEGHFYAVGSTLLLPLKRNEATQEIAPQIAKRAVLLTQGPAPCLPPQICPGPTPLDPAVAQAKTPASTPANNNRSVN